MCECRVVQQEIARARRHAHLVGLADDGDPEAGGHRDQVGRLLRGQERVAPPRGRAGRRCDVWSLLLRARRSAPIPDKLLVPLRLEDTPERAGGGDVRNDQRGPKQRRHATRSGESQQCPNNRNAESTRCSAQFVSEYSASINPSMTVIVVAATARWAKGPLRQSERAPAQPPQPR